VSARSSVPEPNKSAAGAYPAPEKNIMLTYDRTDYRRIQHLIPSIDRYVNQHIRCGDFLNGVLENDLITACCHADWQNVTLIPIICNYLMFTDVPPNAWGSPKRVQAWLSQKASV
jgi:hypothetical protein